MDVPDVAVIQPGSTTEIVHGSGSEHANVLLTWENTAIDSRFSSRQKDIHAMRVSHSFPAISATFDDPNLVSCAGLAPTMALAQRAGLTDRPRVLHPDLEGRRWCERPLEVATRGRT